MTTKRNAYIRPVRGNWWQSLPFYRLYMLREGTALPALWFSIELIIGLFALKLGPDSWAGFVSFLQHPIVLLLNLVALVAALHHSKTWFDLAPKAQIIIVKGEKLPPEPVIKGLWLALIILSGAVLAVSLLA
ncbi:fumarate reductase subunit FrdC [Erwinia persicina]|uniref:fumarate reductase subunit FrdC n=1 Tax=Erwinia persicina TaxID=55211 RepID=UPI00177BB863|nr:fumarate reductase subunit FrdC [Erwinia persicina]MBD8168067.1 fumarate reductase subunit FrdC [Erwinia persicina]MCQ4094352.1 fumarate reductase subunit FrdC [Erwinia persicina]MCQ4101141.1 fumarate reductase subunit FrdC [Erwinia persicina]